MLVKANEALELAEAYDADVEVSEVVAVIADIAKPALVAQLDVPIIFPITFTDPDMFKEPVKYKFPPI